MTSFEKKTTDSRIYCMTTLSNDQQNRDCVIVMIKRNNYSLNAQKNAKTDK